MNESKSYHHDNLSTELVSLAFRMAQTEGPDNMNLRELARQANVSHMAVYRHFPDQGSLLQEVTKLIVHEVAKSMKAYMQGSPHESDSIEATLKHLHAICYGYVVFAQEQPELFRTMWSKQVTHPSLLELDARDDEPYLLLSTLVDRLVALDYVDEALKDSVKMTIWSMACGLAILVLDGPLHNVSSARRDEVVHQAITMCLNGIQSVDRR